MGRKFLFFFITTLCVVLAFVKCRKQSLISPIPNITYLGYNKISYQNFASDSLIYIRFQFEDGDGNMGLSITDSTSPFRVGERFYYNVFAEYLPGKNGVYAHIINGNDTVNYNDRIANLEPDTRNKAINGIITLKLDPIVGLVVPDSIKLNIYIVDKKLNTSNIISTGAIPVNF